MSKSKIEWTERVWNPVTGCTKISPGCQNCYAERMSKRLAGRAGYPMENPFTVTLHPERLGVPLRWRKPSRIFVCSMGDLFHDDVPEIYILQAFAVMAQAPQHTYMVLTKRHERMHEVLTSPTIANDVWLMTETGINGAKPIWPLPNVIGMVTAENQEMADLRITYLLKTPFATRGVSVGPMLGPIDLTHIGGDRFGWGRIDAMNGLYYIRANATEYGCEWETEPYAKLNLVICEGESGPGARPMHPDWARSLRDQCVDSGINFFFKQWGEWSPAWIGDDAEAKKAIGLLPDGTIVDWMGYEEGKEEMYRFGKKVAGRLLDGRTWNQFPEVSHNG